MDHTVCMQASRHADMQVVIPARRHAWMISNMQTCLHAYACRPDCKHACMDGCLPTCITACLRACPQAWLQTCLYVCMHACMHVCMQACMHVRMHAFMPAWLPAGLNACLSVYGLHGGACLLACMHGSIDACLHACIHVCIPDYMLACLPCLHICHLNNSIGFNSFSTLLLVLSQKLQNFITLLFISNHFTGSKLRNAYNTKFFH